MKNLYIIGNGFDIHHNMPTSYKAFYRWLQEKSYYRVLTLIERIYGCADATWWNDFEITYYSEQDKTRIIDFISKYAIPECNVEMKQWSELQNKDQLSLW